MNSDNTNTNITTDAMTRNEVVNSGYETEIVAEIEVDAFDVIIIDLASLDDDGWQIRNCYVSPKGRNAFLQLSNGDGYNGCDIAEQCGFPTQEHTDKLCAHLRLSEDNLEALFEKINDKEHLNSTDWSILERLKDAAQRIYEVDAAMLGSEFKGDNNSLTAFVAILREFAPDWTITAIIDSYNGADNNVPEEVEYEIDQAFSSALDQHSEQYPNDWN